MIWGSMIKSNILYIPSTIDPATLDDKQAYFVNYLYTYPFKFKHRIRSQVLAQKFLKRVPTEEVQLRGSDSTDSGLITGSDFVQSSQDKVSGFPFLSYVFTSDNYLNLWDGWVPVYSQMMRKGHENEKI